MTAATTAEGGVLERHFRMRERGTNTRTEVLAGFTTFLTMAYIVLVNPAILGQAGLPVASVAAATCFAAAFADRKSTRLNSSHIQKSRMPSSA